MDETQEIIQIACEFRLVKAAGAWYTIDCALREKDHPAISKILIDNEINPDNEELVEKFFKFQGISNLSEFLNKHPPVTEFIYSKLKELF